ncbi:MAG TPA: hypothetical protein VMT46_05955, partial [Anaerolineaceae bacterium]|nr:hypothetical protein [Anaerolineaceae bacterium]
VGRIAKTIAVPCAHVGHLIYNHHTSPASLQTGRHQSESVADFIGMRIIGNKKLKQVSISQIIVQAEIRHAVRTTLKIT